MTALLKLLQGSAMFAIALLASAANATDPTAPPQATPTAQQSGTLQGVTVLGKTKPALGLQSTATTSAAVPDMKYKAHSSSELGLCDGS